MGHRCYLSTRFWIPADLVDERELQELYIHHQFDEPVCRMCSYRPVRPCKVCYTCPGYKGETSLYSKRQTEEGIFMGLPLAQWRKARQILNLEDIPVTDMRPRIPFPQDLRFTGKLYDGSKPGTIDQQYVVDRFWEKVIETKRNAGIIEAAARSGKTFIAAHILCELGFRTFITAAEIAWLEGFVKAFVDMTNLHSLHNAVVLISNKKSSQRFAKVPGVKVLKSFDEPIPEEACIVLAAYQSFTRDPKRIVRVLHNKFTTLVVDEADNAAAYAFSKVIGNMDVTFRIALTATVDRVDGMTPILIRLMGQVAVRVDAVIYPPKFTLVETGVFVDTENMTMRTTLLGRSATRNKIILKQAFSDLRAHENNCLLIPVSRLTHMNKLARMINEQAAFENSANHEKLRKEGKVPKDIWPYPLAMTYSGETKDHGLVREKAAARDIRIVVAYIKKVQRGLSVSAWNIIYTGLSPISTGPGFYQLVARVSTPPDDGEEKQQPLIRHFIDGYPASARTFANLWNSPYNSLALLIKKGKVLIDEETQERVNKIISSSSTYTGPAGKLSMNNKAKKRIGFGKRSQQ
jgi:hypothetical protein